MTFLLVMWLVVAITWGVSVLALHAEREWHHLWIGLAVTLVALILPWHAARLIVGWLGLVIGADDAGQHFLQWVRRDPSIRSPLHLLYRRLYGRLPKWGQL